MKKPFTSRILGVNTAVTNIRETVNLIISQINNLEGKFISLSNVYTMVMSDKDEEYRNIQNAAFLALPEGNLLTMIQRLRGYRGAEQITGPDLMEALWKSTQNTDISHYFYGGSQEMLEALKKNLLLKYPGMKIAGMEETSGSQVTEEDDRKTVKRINESGAAVVWVGLDVLKQEKWMYEHQDSIHALMLGVGAGLNDHAGIVGRASGWLRNRDQGWLYRLMQSPKEPWTRYMQVNAKFLLLSVKDAFIWKKHVHSDRKNLLIYAHYYYPDVASTGQILTELAEGLNDTFHTTVICTVPSYTGKIPQHYRKHKYYFENIGGVDVLRIRIPEFRKNFALSRIFNIVSYFFSAILATFRVEHQDYVFTISQPPMLGGMLGVIGKRIKKAKLIYNIQDFNPEQVQAVKFTHNKLILDIMMKLDKYSCTQADRVIVVGRDMIGTLKKRFDTLPPYAYINNWIDEKEIVPLLPDNEQVMRFKRQYGLQGKLVIMYSGNIGLYYDLLNIMKLIEGFRDQEEVVFAFIGEGSMLEELQTYREKKQLSNVVFIPYQDKDKLVYSLNAGDIHFVVNAKGIKGVSVPSKLYGVMAAGKPVLGILEEGSEARLIVEESGCGISVEPGDYEAIEALIRTFVTMKQDCLTKMGNKGRDYLVRHLTKDVSISKYRDEILSCITNKTLRQ